MKILIVSSSDSKGGAAVVARTLVQGMRSRGHHVTFLVSHQDDPNIESTAIHRTVRKTPQARSFVDRVIHRLGVNILGLNCDFPRTSSPVDFREFDVIHLHDIASFNLRYLPWLSRQSAVIWTAHSMTPITGNCVFSFDCSRWKTNCGSCPQFGTWPLNWQHRDGSRLNMLLKRWFYSRSQVRVVGVSDWISGQVRESAMKRFPVCTIQNAIDTEAFTPIPKADARSRLGISADRFVIAFSVASNPLDTRKGIDIIQSAAGKLSPEHKITFLPMSIGASPDQLNGLLQGNRQMLPPAHLSTAEDLSLYYSSADVIWHPSRADTSSMVSMEAMACGTPVIAARVGGVPEVVGESGILIDPESPEKLAQATLGLISDPTQHQALANSCRPRVLANFSIDRFLDEHYAEYERATGAR